MKIPSNDYVYHGSSQKFDSEYAKPKRNKRVEIDDKTVKSNVIFDQNSFHATPYKWIALAYTYKSVPYQINDKTAHYNIGVSLYENNKEVSIFGFDSLEDSLHKLYGDGGYVYHFDKDNFVHKNGLGDLEVISTKQIKPTIIEKINDPVMEMKKLGVIFHFIDLGLSENEKDRNYY